MTKKSEMAELMIIVIFINYKALEFQIQFELFFHNNYLAHVIEQPNFRIPNPQYLQRNFDFDFFNDSENTFGGLFESQKELEKVA